MEGTTPAEQLTIVPANDASWADLQAIFGTTDNGGLCRRGHPTVRRVVVRIDFEQVGDAGPRT